MDCEIIATLDIVNKTYQLKVGRNYLIGKKTDSGSKLDIELQNGSVDDKHAVIQISDGATKILDLYSKFGTFLNGHRINGLAEETITTTASLLFGEVGAKLQFCSAEEKSHDSSGFNDGQKNSSDIIPSSPEIAITKCISRLKQADKNSATSTPNCNLAQKRKCETAASMFDTSFQSDFLAPQLPIKKSSSTARKSLNISLSSLDNSLDDKSSDNFGIPETQQYKQQATNRNSSVTDNSINVNRLYIQSNIDNDDEFCIPETQELAPNFSIKPQKIVEGKQTLVDGSLKEEIFNDTSDSQFRICTQDFYNDENLDNPDSNFLLSLEIPCIKHKPVEINNSTGVLTNTENIEENRDTSKMSALNWSKHDSKDTTLNCEQSERDLACTPDLFDLPELAQANIQINLISSPKSEVACNLLGNETTEKLQVYPDKPSTSSHANQSNIQCQTNGLNKILEPSLFEDESDLMPTQVFFKHDSNKNSATAAKGSPEYLTMSDKENMLPDVSAVLERMDELQPTQLLPGSTSSNVSHDNDKKGDLPITSTDLNLALEESTQQIKTTEKSLPATQVFHSARKNINSLVLANESSEKQTLLLNELFEKTPEKSKENEFLKPVGLKKVSTLSNVSSSMCDNSDIDMLMCTPQIIADNFNQPNSKIKTSLVEKQRRLFGDDSDDDEGDVLKLITAPKVSHDFDKLLPHLKTQASPKRQQEEGKLHRYNRSFSSNDETKSKCKIKIAASRDERHAARDKTREKEHENLASRELEKTVKILDGKGIKSRSKTRSDAGSRSIKTEKDEVVNKLIEHPENFSRNASSSNKVQKKRKNVESSSRNDDFKESKKSKTDPIVVPIEPFEKKLEQKTVSGKKNIHTRATHSRSHSPSAETETIKTPFTQLKSQIEDREIESSSNKSGQKANKTTKSNKSNAKAELNNRRMTRSCSRDTKDSFSTKDTERGLLRSTKSLDVSDSNKRSVASSTPSMHQELSKQLQVAMTMVDPDLFQNHAKNSSGIWTVTDDPSECDILIMDKGNRTFKFLVAMARGIPVVTSSWLETINKAKEIKSMTKNFFKDESFEKRHKFILIKTVELARKQKLFKEYSFLMTPNIRPQCDEMKVIVKCAGGTILEEVPSQQNTKLYLISTKDDQKLWHKYRRINNNIRIISSEGIMSSVIRHDLKPLDSNIIG